MARPTRVFIDPVALLHNVHVIKSKAVQSEIIAMVKANAYGCGLAAVIPLLEGQVSYFGVASLEEAMAVRAMGARTPCVLFHGIFSKDELAIVDREGFGLVIHTPYQLEWLLAHPFKHQIKVWLKFNTGMHRLGFDLADAKGIIATLIDKPFIKGPLGLMSHFASADCPTSTQNELQMQRFLHLIEAYPTLQYSMANSAAILTQPASHFHAIRPGLMLYGASPFANMTGAELGLLPVMHFTSAISAIHHYPPHSPVGYGGTWMSDKASVIGVVPVGYGDGYPRHLQQQAYVYVNGQRAPIVGRVSMDMLTIDLTAIDGVEIGAPVELWGGHITVEEVARAAGTIAYELLCQVSPRAREMHPVSV